MLQEMKSFFFRGDGTPKVWLMTAFWTGSICEGVGGHSNSGVGPGRGQYKTPQTKGYPGGQWSPLGRTLPSL